MLETRINNKYSRTLEVEIHDTEILNPEAKLAAFMVERWGMIMGSPDGEDSTGRARCKIMPVSEMVERAFNTAELVMETARKKGLVHTAPTFEEIEKVEKSEKELRK